MAAAETSISAAIARLKTQTQSIETKAGQAKTSDQSRIRWQKTRKLEFLVGQALEQAADTLVIRQGVFKRGETVLFWHTGGAPALFAYAEETFVPTG